jgi:hypothetical protein
MPLRMKAVCYFKMFGIVQWYSYIPNTIILSVTVSMMQFVNMFEAPLSETFFLFTVCLLYIAECGLFREKKVHQLHDKDYSSSFGQQHIHVRV